LFAQRSNAVRPNYLAMLAQVKYFHRRARAVLASNDDELTLQEFLAAGHLTRYFTNHFMLPLVSAVWSCGFDGARGYPARYLFTFLDNHGMLTVTGSPQWRTVSGGSRSYVEKAAKNLAAVNTATPIRSITRHPDGVEIRDDADQLHHADRVVIASHPDQALGLLADPTDAETRLLSAFSYLPSTTLLHTDASVLPRNARARASWNYRMDSCESDDGRVKISYDLKLLQRITDDADYVVTLNADGAVDPAKVLAEMTYAHPTYTRRSVAAQRELHLINAGRTAFAGAWQGWGFHEDGCASGVRAAESFGAGW
jgi:predicted NAD/FAD-binding protein